MRNSILVWARRSTVLPDARRLPLGAHLPWCLALSAACVGSPRLAAAQSPDSASPRPAYPLFRPLIIQSGLLPGRRLQPTYRGAAIDDVRARPGSQLRALLTAPLLLTKPVTVLASLSYLRESAGFDGHVRGFGPLDLAYARQEVGLSISALHQDSLWGRPVTYLASLTGQSRNVKSLEKLTGGVTAILTLRSTPRTRLSAGLTLQLNPSQAIPVIPVVSYWHRYARSRWELDAVLPSRVHLRRPLPAGKGWLSVGTDLVTTHSFGPGAALGLGSTLEATTANLQTGVLVEYPLMRFLLGGLRAGLDSPLSMQVGRKNSPEAAIKATGKQAGYTGMTLSVVVPPKR